MSFCWLGFDGWTHHILNNQMKQCLNVPLWFWLCEMQIQNLKKLIFKTYASSSFMVFIHRQFHNHIHNHHPHPLFIIHYHIHVHSPCPFSMYINSLPITVIHYMLWSTIYVHYPMSSSISIIHYPFSLSLSMSSTITISHHSSSIIHPPYGLPSSIIHHPVAYPLWNNSSL